MKGKNNYRSFVAVARERYNSTTFGVKIYELLFRVVFYMACVGWAFIPLIYSESIRYISYSVLIIISVICITGQYVLLCAFSLFNCDILTYLPISNRDIMIGRFVTISKKILAISVIGSVSALIMEILLYITGEYEINLFIVPPLIIANFFGLFIYITETIITILRNKY
ncbi:MAG: hypothetical protein ACI4E1_01230 [Lachnospira sp.]